MLDGWVVTQKVGWAGRQSISARVEEDNSITLLDLALTLKVSCQDILRRAETAGNIVGRSRSTRLGISENSIYLKIPSDDLAHAARQQVVLVHPPVNNEKLPFDSRFSI